MITLYSHPMSPCAQKVRIVLTEKNLDWTLKHVDLPNKENLTPEYLRLNPLGVVPTLVHDGKPVIESSIICEFLEDQYPSPTLRPQEAHARAQMRYWMKHVDNKLHPSCGALQWPMAMRPALMEKSKEEREALLNKIPEAPRRERQKRLAAMGLDAPDVAAAVKTYRQTILDMETALMRHKWIVSDDFTLADACLAPYFQTLLQFSWTGLFSGDCNRVAEWFDQCQSRLSYQTAVASDFPEDLLKKLQADGKAVWRKISAHIS